MPVLQIRSRTTNSQSEFQKFSLSSNSCIYTTAADKNIEEFSIELSLGDGWNDNYSVRDMALRKIDDSIIVRGHGSIVVVVAEEMNVPHNKYGVVLPTGSLFLSRGILIASAKVEPAFNGKLKLRLFNTTNQKVTLAKGEKLGSVIFFSTESTKEREPINRFSDISAPPLTLRSRLWKWLIANKIIWIGWIISIFTSSIFAFLLTYNFYYKNVLENKLSNSEANTKNQKPPVLATPK